MDQHLAPLPPPPAALSATPRAPGGGAAFPGDARSLVEILRRHVRMIAITLASCLAAALLYVTLARPTYRAAASVRIDERRQQDQASGLNVLGLTGGSEV